MIFFLEKNISVFCFQGKALHFFFSYFLRQKHYCFTSAITQKVAFFSFKEAKLNATKCQKEGEKSAFF